AIGQGDFLATPAQVAMAAAAVGNNGVRMRPRLVTEIKSAEGDTVTSFEVKTAGNLPISPQNLSTVQSAMLGPTGPGGTAYSSFPSFNIQVAGKTGSAEDPPRPPHSWFMSYAPASPGSGGSPSPQIATGVLVINSAFGEVCAVPTTLQILRAHF